MASFFVGIETIEPPLDQPPLDQPPLAVSKLLNSTATMDNDELAIHNAGLRKEEKESTKHDEEAAKHVAVGKELKVEEMGNEHELKAKKKKIIAGATILFCVIVSISVGIGIGIGIERSGYDDDYWFDDDDN